MYAIRFVFMPLLLLSLTTACSHTKSYLVSIYQLDDTQAPALNTYYQSTQALLDQHNGRYLDAPLIIEEELPNAAQPAVTDNFPGNQYYVSDAS